MAQVPIRYCSVSDVAEGIEAGATRRARFSNKEIRALVLTKSFLNQTPPPTEEEITERLKESVELAIERATKEALSVLVKRNNLEQVRFETLEQVPPEIRNYVADMAAYFLISMDSSQPTELILRYERGYRMAREFFMNHVIISVTEDKTEELEEGQYNKSTFFLRESPTRQSGDYL